MANSIKVIVVNSKGVGGEEQRRQEIEINQGRKGEKRKRTQKSRKNMNDRDRGMHQ